MAFIITITLPVLDLAYTVANMQVCSSFDGDSQALAGSIFSVATRVSLKPNAVYPRGNQLSFIHLARDFDRFSCNIEHRHLCITKVQYPPLGSHIYRSTSSVSWISCSRLDLLWEPSHQSRYRRCWDAWNRTRGSAHTCRKTWKRIGTERDGKWVAGCWVVTKCRRAKSRRWVGCSGGRGVRVWI